MQENEYALSLRIWITESPTLLIIAIYLQTG